MSVTVIQVRPLGSKYQKLRLVNHPAGMVLNKHRKIVLIGPNFDYFTPYGPIYYLQYRVPAARALPYGALRTRLLPPVATPPPSCACHTGRYRRASAQPAAARNSGAPGRPVGLSKAVVARPPRGGRASSGGGYETPAPLRSWRLRNPRAPSVVAVT
jgi:hypothetical protein